MTDDSPAHWTFTDDAPIDVTRYVAVRSPLKYCVLEFAERNPGFDYEALAAHLDMPDDYAHDRLLKYAYRGLLERDRGRPGERSTYRLDERGRERLAAFRSGV